MLKNHTDNIAKSMTIQSIECLTKNNTETMQSISDKASNQQQQQITSSKNGHISFSVASLLADTRPSKPSMSPNTTTPAVTLASSVSIPTTSPLTNHSSDEEYDSNQEDSIVDVEDLNSDQKSPGSPSKEQQDDAYLSQQQQREREFQRDGLMSQGPIRPTPFSALAAAVYQAAHPNWASQGLVGPFPGPGHMFQGPAAFGVPNLSSGEREYLYYIVVFVEIRSSM